MSQDQDQSAFSNDGVDVLGLIDKIVTSDDDADIKDSIAVLRKLGGDTPSIYIKQVIINSDEFRKLFDVSPIPDSKGTYSFEDFLGKLQRKMGRTYGWCVDYVQASQSPDCREVKNEEIQRWRKLQRVPAWAFEQIEKLTFSPRKGDSSPPWSTDENKFLIELYNGTAIQKNGELYKTSPKTTNVVLAGICSDKFGRNITENSIKGALDRQRKKGKLPKRRKQDLLVAEAEAA